MASHVSAPAPPLLEPTTSRVGDLLGRPLLTCPAGSSVEDAARLMGEQNSEAIVVLGSSGQPSGIITDSDLRRRVLAAGLPGSTRVEQVMSTPLVTIESDALFFEAVHEMLRRQLHHLVVVEAGHPRGVIADGDLLAARAQGPLFMARQIDRAGSIQRLVDLGPVRQQGMRLLFRAGVSAYNLARIMAEMNDRLVRRVLALLESELGPPPIPYCWLGLGSEGRREQALKTDQDNALAYKDPPAELADGATRYFADLAARTVDALVHCGFPRCHGEIMASNPRWCQPLAVWRKHFMRWVKRPEPEALYNAAIFFDLRPVAGDSALADELWSDLLEWIPESPLFIQLFMRSALVHRPPLGFFRNFVVEHSGEHRGGFHIKARGLMPIVEAARAYALARGVTRTNTFERLRALRELGEINQADANDLLAAYEFVIRLRIRHHLDLLESGQPLDDFIVPDQLSRVDRKTLKEHFKVIAQMQSYIESRVLTGVGA